MIKTITIAAGIKRLVNIQTGRDVLIAQEGGEWLMIANYGQSDAHSKIGTFATIKAAREAIA